MIVSGAVDSFKTELFRKIHDFGADVFKIALYLETADLGPATTEYTAVGEASGTGYSAGGTTLTVSAMSYGSGVSWVNFDTASWPGASFSARAALVYNSSQANRAVMILDFGVTRLFSASSNSITFPVSGPNTAPLRIGYAR